MYAYIYIYISINVASWLSPCGFLATHVLGHMMYVMYTELLHCI